MNKQLTMAAVVLSMGMPLALPATSWANHHDMTSPADREKKLDKMAKDLGLTQEQKNQVRSIKEEKHRKMEEAEKECHDKIRALLNPGQQTKFDKLIQDKD